MLTIQALEDAQILGFTLFLSLKRIVKAEIFDVVDGNIPIINETSKRIDYRYCLI